MNKEELTLRRIEAWRILAKEGRTWILFEHGTCVFWDEATYKPEDYAIDILKKYGFIVPRTPAGNFDQNISENPPGMLVTYYHQDILTFLLDEELKNPEIASIPGLLARHRHQLDAEELNIVHIELSNSTV